VSANERIEKETTEDMKGELQHGMFMHVIAIFFNGQLQQTFSGHIGNQCATHL
jgi:hypothetical protein